MRTFSEELKEMSEVWPKVSGIISVPRTKRQYEKMVRYLDMLVDDIGNDQYHSLVSLMETLGTLIEAYEEKNIPEPRGDPISVLKSLMADHDLKQKDMKEIGSQGVVSEVMNEKRKLNTRQIDALAKRFNVSPAVFM